MLETCAVRPLSWAAVWKLSQTPGSRLQTAVVSNYAPARPTSTRQASRRCEDYALSSDRRTYNPCADLTGRSGYDSGRHSCGKICGCDWLQLIARVICFLFVWCTIGAVPCGCPDHNRTPRLLNFGRVFLAVLMLPQRALVLMIPIAKGSKDVQNPRSLRAPQAVVSKTTV